MGETWRAKLSPLTRAAADEGDRPGPLDLLVALHEPLSPAVRRQLEASGLHLVSGNGAVVAGRVPGWPAVRRLAAVPAVRHIELSHPLHPE